MLRTRSLLLLLLLLLMLELLGRRIVGLRVVQVRKVLVRRRRVTVGLVRLKMRVRVRRRRYRVRVRGVMLRRELSSLMRTVELTLDGLGGAGLDVRSTPAELLQLRWNRVRRVGRVRTRVV